MFREFNPNPKQKRVGDCVIRAICAAIDREWDVVYCALLTEGFKLKDMPSANDVWGTFLYDQGFVRGTLENICPSCYTVKDFCDEFDEGTYILALPTHIVTVKNGDYYDTWDSGDEKPIYYWRRTER